MYRRRLVSLVLLILAVCTASLPYWIAHAAPTPAVLAGGICLNEFLTDPNGTTANFDTDNNGVADDLDEFVELYNLSGAPIDISGWGLWDALGGNWFTFPGAPGDGTTFLAPGAYAVVLAAVQPGGYLPVMTNPDSLSFEAGLALPSFNNNGDNLVLYNPGDDEYIQLLYNGDSEDDPTTYEGFSPTARRIGSTTDFGSESEGKSLTRYPSGDTNIVIHDAIPGAGNASPNAIRLNGLSARSAFNDYLPALLLLMASVFLAWTYRLVHQHAKE